jgi:hypothetical protein
MVVRPMSVIERFSIMPSWKDDEQPETIGLKMRTGDLWLMTQKSPVVDIVSFMRTAPGCCCWRALALLQTLHPCP